MSKVISLAATAAVALVTSAHASGGGPSPMIVEKAIKAANRYVARQYPQYDLSTGSVEVRGSTSGKTSIEVVYELPPGLLGGAPTVSLDPQSVRVIKATMGQ